MATLNCQPSFGSSLNSFLHSREWTPGTMLQTAAVWWGTVGNDLTSPPPPSPHSHPIKKGWGGIWVFQTGLAQCPLTQFEFSSSWGQLTHAARSQERTPQTSPGLLKNQTLLQRSKIKLLSRSSPKVVAKKGGGIKMTRRLFLPPKNNYFTVVIVCTVLCVSVAHMMHPRKCEVRGQL